MSVLTIVSQTSGVGANGAGVEINLLTDNSAGSLTNVGAIDGVLANASAGSEAGDLIFKTFLGTLTEKLRITSDGRLYGTALHNNAGSITGTTNQYVASGTYTPPLTGTLNITGSTASVLQYTRVGNVVTVSGQVTINTTANSTASALRVGLPIPSALALATQCGGTMASIGFNSSGGIQADTTNDEALIQWVSQTTGNNAYFVTFTYLIL